MEVRIAQPPSARGLLRSAKKLPSISNPSCSHFLRPGIPFFDWKTCWHSRSHFRNPIGFNHHCSSKSRASFAFTRPRKRTQQDSCRGQCFTSPQIRARENLSNVQAWQDGTHGVVFSTQEMLEATGGKLLLDGSPGSVCTDSRKIEAGDWFVALKSDRFDGHAFLDEVLQKGCAGAIGTHMPSDWPRGFIQVKDPLVALQQLAAHVRSRFDGPVVGITGSSGKTGTRAMVGLALRSLGHVHETRGNLNNHIGVPLTLLATPSRSCAMVLELGMNHAGEIAELSRICRPSVRLITNVGPVHLEGLGTVEAVAKAKGELFDTAAPGDTIVLNMDDPLVSTLPIPEGVRIVRYGSGPGADVSISDVRTTDGGLSVECALQRIGRDGTLESFPLRIEHPGLHLVKNAAAAAAVAAALRVPLKEAVENIQQYEPVGMRMKVQKHSNCGVTLLNDAYNANPMSMKAAVEVLAQAECTGRKVALLGDMLELGDASLQAHVDILKQCASAGIDLVAVCGDAFRAAAGNAALPNLDLREFPDSASLAAAISGATGAGSLAPSPGDLVLVKGSRGLRMETACDALQHLDGRIHPTK